MKTENLIEIFRKVTRSPLLGDSRQSDQAEESGWLFGTGYAIDGLHILTARHVIGTEIEDVQQIKEIVVRQFSSNSALREQRRKIAVRCIWDCSESDVALLRLTHDIDRMDVETPRLGSIRSKKAFACEGVGFPRGMTQPDLNVRDTFVLSGELNPGIGMKRAEELIYVNSNPFEDEPTLWKGMSGAAMFANDPKVLIGVVVQTPIKLKGRMITMFPIAKISEMPLPLLSLEMLEINDTALGGDVLISVNTTDHKIENYCLADFSVGPMVKHYSVLNLARAYADCFDFSEAKALIGKINDARLRANKDDPNVGQIRRGKLPEAAVVGLENFWLEVFDQAALHGPRMLASVLLSVDHPQLSILARQERRELLQSLLRIREEGSF